MFFSYIVETHLPAQAAHEKWSRNPNDTQELWKREKTMGWKDRIHQLLCKIRKSNPSDP